MPYVPKKRRFHLTWKMGIVFVCIAVGIAALVFWRMDHSEVQGEFHACEFTNSQMRDLEQQSTQTIELEDYLFYGETLSLYMDPYDGEEDEIYGKTMELVNICSGEQYNFTVGNTADRQIFLPDLSDGTYEIYLIDSFQRKRVVFADTVYSDAFQTMRRNGKVKEATLIAAGCVWWVALGQLCVPQCGDRDAGCGQGRCAHRSLRTVYDGVGLDRCRVQGQWHR